MMNIPLIVWQFYCLVLALLAMQIYVNDPLFQQQRLFETQIPKSLDEIILYSIQGGGGQSG
jgi:hypothetical protein